MKSLWSDEEAARFRGDLPQRIYTSRLLGREPALVLHGGGNTSVKIAERSLVGEEETILWVKGSGGDLAKIDESGFSPVRMAHLLALAKLPALPDPQMVNELRTHMTRASAPTPSIEAILHALLPWRYVDHTHADAVVTVTNAPGAADRVRDIWGDTVVVVPYVMPGFDLARACAERLAKDATPRTVGMVLVSHGIFSFGETARESYERMIALVTRAEEHLARKGAFALPAPPPAEPAAVPRRDVGALRDSRWCSRCTPTRGASPSRGGPTWRCSRSRARPRRTTSSAPSGSRSSAATWRATPRPTGAGSRSTP